MNADSAAPASTSTARHPDSSVLGGPAVAVAPSGPSLPLPLSLSVVSCNEERNLRRCLASASGLAEEIVVVDSGSTDGTVEVAESFGARVVRQPWLGFRDQKNFALDRCTREWVLALDCDEELSPELRASILRFFSAVPEGTDGAGFPRKVHFLGRWITHGDWYPDWKLRLVRRRVARWGGTAEHDRLEVPGGVARLEGDLHHYSFPSINRYVEKINVFGDAFLERRLAAGRRWSLAENLLRPLWRFFRCYVLRRGFLDGFPGLWIAVGIAFQTFVRYSRTFEHERCAAAAGKGRSDSPPAPVPPGGGSGRGGDPS